MANKYFHQQQLDFYKKKLGDLSYTEAVALIEEMDQTIHDLGPFDPAVAYFYTQRESMQRFADCFCHAFPDDEAYRAHLVKKTMLFTIDDGEIREAEAYVPKWYKEGTSDYRIRLASAVYEMYPNVDRRNIEIISI